MKQMNCYQKDLTSKPLFNYYVFFNIKLSDYVFCVTHLDQLFSPYPFHDEKDFVKKWQLAPFKLSDTVIYIHKKVYMKLYQKNYKNKWKFQVSPRPQYI